MHEELFELNLFVSEIFRKATCLQLKYNEIMESKQDLNHKCYVFSITSFVKRRCLQI